MRRVGAVPNQEAVEEDENLPKMSAGRRSRSEYKDDWSTWRTSPTRVPPSQRVPFVEGKEGPEATEGSESNVSQEK